MRSGDQGLPGERIPASSDAPSGRPVGGARDVSETDAVTNRTALSAQSNLTLDQLHVWMGQSLVPDAPVYHIAVALNLFEQIEPGAFEAAFQALVDSSDALRTTIDTRDGVPRRVVHPRLSCAVEQVDFSRLGDPRAAAETWMLSRAQIPFDPADRLFDSALIRLSRKRFVWYLNCHHLIADGWSFELIYRQMERLYAEALRGGRPAKVDLPRFEDYVAWEREYRGSARHRRAEAYWRRTQAQRDAPLSFYGEAAARRTTRVRRVSCDLGPERTRKLRDLAGAGPETTQGSSLVALFCSVLVAYLHRLHDHETYAIGLPFHNRRSARFKETIGFFSQMLPIRVRIARGETFTSLSDTVRAAMLETLRHSPYALANPPHRTVYDVVVNYHVTSFARFHDTEARAEWIHTGHGGESLTLQIRDFTASGTLTLDFDFHCDTFTDDDARRAVGHVLSVLDAFLESPSQRVDRVVLPDDDERQRVLVQWNATAVEYPRGRRLHELVEAQAARTPEAIAVASEGAALTYRDLDGRANQLARYLRERGVGAGTLVGIHLRRSSEMLVAVLATLKAGGAYVPLDPAYPAGWLAGVLEETRPAVVLTHTSVAASLARLGPTAVCLDGGAVELARQSRERVATPTNARDLAYVIYTSGSTGRPKGVEITHEAVVNFSAWAARAFRLGRGDRVLQFASLSFDTAVEEIFPSLSAGATLVLRAEGMLDSIDTFVQRCAADRITVLDLPTAYWHELVAALAGRDLGLPEELRLVIIGGEDAHPDRLAQWQARVGTRVRLVNTYGPTETTVVATMAELEPGAQGATATRRVSIGRPIANVQVYILDRGGLPVPVGVPGELFIGGLGLARGYHRRPDLTAERFVPHPFSDEPGARLYRTGDVARHLPDGRIEFLGRADRQVKIRGFRIEPGEIETALREHHAVRDAVVVVRERGTGDRSLTAYVVSDQADLVASGEWRRFLRGRLPEHMIPATAMQVPALPRTASGKLDRAALPEPDGAATEAAAAVPRSPLQDVVARIWCDVLELRDVGVDANFFELGGHSLLATQVVSRLRSALGVDIGLRDVFDAPTVAGLAERLQTLIDAREQAPDLPSIGAAARAREMPLSASQRRMWFSHHLAPESGAYNVAAPIRLTGRLHRDALRRSVAELIRRHESLRTTFPVIDGAPVQVIAPAQDPDLEEVDLRNVPATSRLAEARRVLTEAARRPFDLARGPLYRLLLVQLDDEDHLVLLTMHHVISDHWSLGVIGREVAALYNGALGAAAPVPAAPVQYADFALWQQQRSSDQTLQVQRAYWKRQLAGLQPLELPTDRVRPAVQTFRGGHVSLDLPDALLEGLSRLGVRCGASLYMILLAAFSLLLHRYTGQEDIAVGSPIANRHHLAFEDTVGTFVNTLVLRADLSGNPPFRHVVARVREVALEAYAHQDFPFDKLVEELQPQRDPSRPPLVSVLFNLQNAPIRNVDLHGLSWTPFEIDAWASQFDISLTVDAAILKKMAIIYNADLHDAASMTRLLRHFRNILESVAANPETRISDVPLLADEERRALVYGWNATTTGGTGARCFLERFETQVRRTPAAVAVECGEARLTYHELHVRASQIADRLLRLGVGREARVAICIERSPDMVAGLLGIMQAGAAYVPLDPDLPRSRIAFMLRDSGAVAVLTQERLAPLLPDGVRIVSVDRKAEALTAARPDGPGSRIRPSDLAYVIYTSGSTGVPKGVEVTHGALVNLLESMEREPGLAQDDVLLAVTTIAFDIAALELYLPLMVGARVVIAPRETVGDGRRLIGLLDGAGATVMQATPATWRLLLGAGWQGRAGLTVLCGGEALTPDLADALLARSRTVWNVYGPTETTIWSTAWRVQPGEPSVGRPIANTQVYILDRHLQPVPPGVRGELYIGGDGLARGYHRRPDLTAERFVPNPFGPAGTRLFRTGDLASYRADGTIRLLGRTDHQVKIHGYRVELEEIEVTLGRHPDVEQAAVVAREDAPGDRRLVAYVVLRPGRPPTAEALRQFLLQHLPAYMAPRAFVVLDRLPLTPSGKIDRRALPAPESSPVASRDAFVAPRDALERRLVAIWEKLLGKHPVGVRDDFFELGGHSLLAAHLFVEIERTLGKHLPIATLFQAPTVEQLAEVVRNDRAAAPWTSVVPVQRNGSARPFFWVHGDSSTLPLARYLGPDQPLYGFDHQGADGRPARHVSVEAIAAHYTSELLTVQPAGPYALGGYSFGGVVAFEMAQQLRRRGHDVGLLVLLCPSVPRRGRAPRERAEPPRRPRWSVIDEARRHGRALARLTPNERLGYIGRRLKGAVAARVGPIIKSQACRSIVKLGLPVPPSLRSHYILGIYFRALERYAADRYPGPALLFAEKDSPETARYWRAVLAGPTEFHALSARHEEVVTPLYLEAWAQHVRSSLCASAPERHTGVAGDLVGPTAR